LEDFKSYGYLIGDDLSRVTLHKGLLKRLKRKETKRYIKDYDVFNHWYSAAQTRAFSLEGE
jgi:hypothetical protein